jgi:hypothetical protein
MLKLINEVKGFFPFLINKLKDGFEIKRYSEIFSYSTRCFC